MAKKNVVVTSFSISANNIATLNHLAKELHISKSSILNDLLNKHLQTSKGLMKLKSIPKENERICKSVEISLTQNQYDLLSSAAKNSITNSVPKFIKFQALSMIYENKILDNKEIEALALTRAELNKIGININQIARALNSQNETKIDLKLLEILESLENKITHISSHIKTLCHNSQELLK